MPKGKGYPRSAAASKSAAKPFKSASKPGNPHKSYGKAKSKAMPYKKGK